MTLLQDLKMQYRTGGMGIRLIFWNLLFFVVPEVLFALLRLFGIENDYLYYVSLSSTLANLAWKPWSLVTYAFFHGGIIHLVLNMLMLNFIAQLFTTFFTQKQLLGAYVLGAVFSGLVFLAGYAFFPVLTNQNTQMVGASGAIMALLFATVTYQPFMDVRLFGVFRLQLWKISFFFIFIDLIQLPLNNTGGHIAHLAGALFGFLYVKLLQQGTDLSRIVTAVIDFFVNLVRPSQTTTFKRVHVNPRKAVVKTESKVVMKDKTQQQIDEILDKISQSGYDSLTAAEKEFLFKAGK